MSIVYQRNKSTGITYAYSNEAYWDKEKRQSRAKRKLLGKVDPETGEIVATRAYEKKVEKTEAPSQKSGLAAISKIRRSYYGAIYLLSQIGETTGVAADLRACFPATYEKILSIAYFLILEENNALSRFSHWQRQHIHPYGEDIPSQRSSELFQSIDEESKMRFFMLQGRRRIEKEYWVYDLTTISSYSEVLKQVKHGKNKEHDRLPQLSLALLFGEESLLPFYYRKLPGNIRDVSTIKQLLREFDVMGYKKVNIVLDRGFYSKANIDEYGVYGACRTIEWEYEQQRPYKGDTIKEKRRAYLLLYYNPEKAARDEADANAHLASLYRDLEEGELKPYRTKEYTKYFEVKQTPKRGRKITVKEDVICAEARNYGYFALLSNEVKDPYKALLLYRSKDIDEKAFGNLKDRLDCRRLQVSSELALDGKLFVEFIALIYLSYVKKKMQDAHLFGKWTLQSLLDELDIIELFQAPGHGRAIGEITTKQADIFKALQLPLPSLYIPGS